MIASWLSRAVAEHHVVVRVDGPPRAWQRARRRGDRYYTSAESSAWRHLVWASARRAAPRAPPGPLRVEVLAVYPRPEERPRCVDAEAWASGRRLWRPVDPDADNLVKGILDALQTGPLVERRWLDDDNRVVRVVVDKIYGAVGEPPHTIVRVSSLGAVYLEVVDG